MGDLRVTEFGSPTNYVGIVGTNISPDDSGSSHQMALASAVGDAEPVTSSVDTFTVAVGTKTVFGGIGNWQSGEVANASMWVQAPDGTKIDTATASDATQQVVFLPEINDAENAVLCFIINDPLPGDWTVGIDSAEETDKFQVIVSTIADDGISGMIETFQALLPDDKKGGDEPASFGETDSATAGKGVSWGCIGCRCVTYPLALALVVVGAAGVGALTATSAIVVAITNLAAWITAPIAIGFLAGLTAGIVWAVDEILTSLCEWVGACP